ncbi:peptidylprolyl isomerase [Acidaminobacterium chupaoyuni]
MKNQKKLLAALLCGVMLFCGGCSPSPTAVTVNKRSVDASETAFYIQYALQNLQNTSGGEEPDKKKLNTKAKESALDQIVSNELVLEKCREYDLTLSKKTRKLLEDEKKYLIKSLGGKAGYLKYLKEQTLTDRTYDKFQANSKYADLLYEKLVGDSGKYAATDEGLRQFFGESFARVQYIRFSMIDDSGKTISEEEVDQAMEKANQVLAMAQEEGADFAALMAQYNDDPYMSASPEGLVMSAADAAQNPQFEELFQLKENAVGGVYVGTDGYYLVKRLPLEPGYFDKNRDAVAAAYRDAKYNELLAGWKEKAAIKTTSVFRDMNIENLKDYVK